MNIPKINASTNFQGVKLNNVKKTLYATAAATALFTATQIKAQDFPTYTFDNSNVPMVPYEQYQTLQRKFQQAIAERQAYQNNQAVETTQQAPTYEYSNRYINIENVEKNTKNSLTTDTIFQALGFFIIGAIIGFFAKPIGKD